MDARSEDDFGGEATDAPPLPVVIGEAWVLKSPSLFPTAPLRLGPSIACFWDEGDSNWAAEEGPTEVVALLLLLLIAMPLLLPIPMLLTELPTSVVAVAVVVEVIVLEELSADVSPSLLSDSISATSISFN